MKRKSIYFTLLPLLGLVGCDHKSHSHAPAAPQSGFALADLDTVHHNIWGARLFRNADGPCSILYDFRRDNTVDFHVLCVAKNHLAINVESYEYKTTPSGNGFQATLVKSSCAKAPTTYSFTAALTKTSMSLSSGQEKLSLQALPESALIESLRSATQLHGKPLVRGCFAPSTNEFVAQEVAP